MALPTVAINSTGSDTAASGAGPATALSGTGASIASSTTVTLLTDNPNLSGVATDGSAVIWVGSSTGRQFAKITGVNNTAGVKTVTVATAYGATESGKNWGIGGKRATIAGSTKLFNADWGLGWTVDIQTGETLSSTISLRAPTPANSSSAVFSPIITSTTYTTWGTQPLVQTATDNLLLFDSATTGLVIRNLSFKSTATTPGICFKGTLFGNQQGITWQNCIFDRFVCAIDTASSQAGAVIYSTIDRCEFKNFTNTTFAPVHLNSSNAQITNCYFHDNAWAIQGSISNISHCVFANNTGQSTITLSPIGSQFTHNTVYNCGNGTTGNVLNLSGGGGGSGGAVVVDSNIFYSNPGYTVVTGSGTYNPASVLNRNNAYGANNGGGTGLNYDASWSAGEGDMTLTASPFVSSTDFALNNTAGGGVLCRAASATIPNASATATAPDVGAVQSGSSSSAGGPVAGNLRGGYVNG